MKTRSYYVEQILKLENRISYYRRQLQTIEAAEAAKWRDDDSPKAETTDGVCP